MEAILEFSHISAGYGRVSVLNDLSFQLRQGTVLGIIGPNGSGKTTMLNVLTGHLRPSCGTIRFAGHDIPRLSPDVRCHLGLGRTFQIPRPFEHMSVFDNVLAAAVFGQNLSGEAARQAAMKALQLTHLEEKRGIRSGSLTLLDRKRLEIARAIGSGPTLLLLDEVAAGLSSAEIQEITGIVAALKASGLSIVWIEHILETMMYSTDVLMCLAEGRCVKSGPPMEVIHSKVVEQLYLGTEIERDPDVED